MKKVEFNNQRARSYRKKAEVLAFRSEAAFSFTKSWGEQKIRESGWVIVPLTESGEASLDVYGCDAKVFKETYEPSPSLRANRYRKSETIRAYQPGEPFQIETRLADGHLEVESSSADSYTTWLAMNPSGETYTIEDEVFRNTYVEVQERGDKYRIRSRDEHWVPDGTPRRILALDGGGVRGILTLQYLARIEEILKQRHGDSDEFRLCHYFDLIAGTSTGAIIAAALARGSKVSEVIDLYDKLAADIFRRPWFRLGLLRAKFSAKRLRQHLLAEFKNNTMGSSAIKTGLLVVAKRLDTGSTWPMSNNPLSPFFRAQPNDTFYSNEDYLLRRVVRASTAAPHYFAPEYIEISTEKEKPHGQFIDGGASPHNNPSLLALQLVSVSGFGAGWELDPDKLLLVSVGTGMANPNVSNSWFAGEHALKSLLSLMNDCAESVETILQWISNSPTARHLDAALKEMHGDLLAERPLLHYLRYNVELDSKWLHKHLRLSYKKSKVNKLKKMDLPSNMKTLTEIGKAAAQHQIEESHFPANFDLW
ncbi:MAG: patatin-like phospholipase family protein [Candidatus Thiodiazotropha sp.]